MKLIYFNSRRLLGTYGWLFLLLVFLMPTNNIVANSQDHDGFEELRRALFDNDGKLVLAAHTDQEDVFLSRVDLNGTILWSKTFGGSNREEISDVLIDPNNNIYVVGETESPDFEILNAFQHELGGSVDFFISKFNSNGELLWSTYYGGSLEEQRKVEDPGYARLTSNNDLVLLGFTTSTDFPVSDSAFQTTYGGGPNRGDMVISKFSTDGEMLWGSYIGTTDEDWGLMKFDNEENIVIRGFASTSGLTSSIKDGFEYSGGKDAYLLKIDQQGELMFSLYYGGSDDDHSFAMDFDNENNILLLTPSFSDDFPIVGTPIQSTKDGESDLTLTKFSPVGDVLWNTYFGGNGVDDVWEGETSDDTAIKLGPTIFVNSLKDFYFSTRTDSTNLDEKFTEVFDYDSDEQANFIGKMTSNGDLLWGRYLGGSYNMNEHLTSLDEVIVTVTLVQNDWEGFSTSQNTYAGSRDVGLAKMLGNGTIEWSGYIGGSRSDEMVNSIYAGNKLYIVGSTTSDDLPDALNIYHGSNDVFVCKIDVNGSNDWCNYFGTENYDYTFGGGMVVDPLSGNLIVFIGTGGSIGTKDTTFGLLARVGNGGETIWSKQIIPDLRVQLEDESNTDISLLLIIIGIFSSLLILGQLYRVNKIKSNIKLSEMLMNESISKIISPLFNNNPELIYLFGLTKQPELHNLPPGLGSDIPKELLDFTFLMHPLRMSIVKLLVETVSLTTVQIKEVLDLTWNDLHPQLAAMKKKRYVTMDKEFVDGQIFTVVRAEPHTITQYNTLKVLLMEFFDATPNIERYIEQVNEWRKTQDEPDLYPRENGKL